MALHEMYTVLADGRRKLVSTFDDQSETISMITNAQPVVMQAPPKLRTSVAPKPKPTPTICPRCHSVQCHCGQEPRPPLAARAERPQVIRTMREARQAVLQELTRDMPQPPSLDAIVAKQRELGLR